MRNVIRRLMGKPVQLSPRQEEKMARMYARAEQQSAKQEAEAAKARAEYEAFMTSQGLEVQPAPNTAAPTSLREIGGLFKQSLEDFKDAIGETFDDRRDVLDPGDADLNKPPAEVEDPAERERIMAVERADRDRARGPFCAPVVPELAFTRFATTGKLQLADVEAALREAGLAAHPERVYGVYRVPTRYELRRKKEGDVRVEWEIAHMPGTLPPATDGVLAAGFKRSDHWAARRPGEPSVLDEDVAGALVSRAGIAPEDCFGLHRLLNVRGSDMEDGINWTPVVEGVLLFTRPSEPVAAAQRAMTAEAPLRVDPPPFHVEILDWEAVAAWVSPHRYGPQRVPSPLPHLPSTWQELIGAYLQVVGVRSDDTYGVQVTRAGDDRSLADLSLASFSKNLRGARNEMHVGQHVVIAYRDRPEYVAGRGRWRLYQDEVLRARLDHLTGVRRPIEVDDHPRQSFLSEVFDMFDPFGASALPQVFHRNALPSLGPYCGELED
ncbi:hypothetical protein [Solirubrobacter soli]|uniref:hypothetical protein n=1 Tax=Solirubrobacter soli TaxID=363832 RepID=UPI000422A15A|nr:hypothetical protein [Solirubrobacter soli]